MKKFLNEIVSLVALFMCFLMVFSCTKSTEFNIEDYGAVGNDTTVLNTAAVQKAIDDCSVNGGKVIIPKGNFQIGTINLKSNVELHLVEGAQLLGSLSLSDYSSTNTGAIEAPAFNKTLLFAENAKNIKITGKGVINGRGLAANFPVNVAEKVLGERPMLIRFINCDSLSFSDVTFRHSASWCCHLVNSDNINIERLIIDNHVNKNNDGLDIDGCKNVYIEDCTIFSGDDGICPKSTTTRITENIVVKNCRVTSNTSAFKCGTSSRGGYRNITVDSCDFSGTRMGAIKLLLVDGGVMEDITISNIVMDNVEGPIFIRLGNRGRDYSKPTEQIQGKDVKPEGVPVGVARNIKISNVKANVVSDVPKRCGIMISGIPGYCVENVLLENIEVSLPGGVKEGEYLKVVDDDIARYPEQFFFGVLPTWGAYIRHAKNIEFRNVAMAVRSEDVRERIMLDDVEDFKETK